MTPKAALLQAFFVLTHGSAGGLGCYTYDPESPHPGRTEPDPCPGFFDVSETYGEG